MIDEEKQINNLEVFLSLYGIIFSHWLTKLRRILVRQRLEPRDSQPSSLSGELPVRGTQKAS